ncbi:MAG TPA: hypothetical protein PLM34_04650, partial [Lentimicrobium sp.]|nr:hypothetical protein [Lentimicrobium sp.]
ARHPKASARHPKASARHPKVSARHPKPSTLTLNSTYTTRHQHPPKTKNKKKSYIRLKSICTFQALNHRL